MPKYFAPARRVRLIAQSAAVVLLMSSCTTTSGKPEDTALLSDQERALRAENERFTTSIIVGCGSGAAIALIISKAKGASTKSTVTNMVLGTIAGCTAGAAAGYYFNSRNKKYANKQQASRELIKAADADIARYQELNRNTDSLIKQQRAKIDNLNRRYKRKELTANGYREQVASAAKNKELLEEKVEEANDNIKLMKHDIDSLKGAGQNTDALERKRQALIVQRNKLEKKVELLAATYDNMPPEVRPSTA